MIRFLSIYLFYRRVILLTPLFITQSESHRLVIRRLCEFVETYETWGRVFRQQSINSPKGTYRRFFFLHCLSECV